MAERLKPAEADREQALKDLAAMATDRNRWRQLQAETRAKLAACDVLPRYQMPELKSPEGRWVKRADLDHVLHPEKESK